MLKQTGDGVWCGSGGETEAELLVARAGRWQVRAGCCRQCVRVPLHLLQWRALHATALDSPEQRDLQLVVHPHLRLLHLGALCL